MIRYFIGHQVTDGFIFIQPPPDEGRGNIYQGGIYNSDVWVIFKFRWRCSGPRIDIQTILFEYEMMIFPFGKVPEVIFPNN